MTSKNETINLRTTHSIAIVITILLGLATRQYGYLLPSFVEHNAGDALWAMMVFFGFRFILVRKSMLTTIWFSLLFCFGIEFSQLYQEDWINQIRGTLLGTLILGKGFLAVDLIRYTTGILIAIVLDNVTIRFTQHKY